LNKNILNIDIQEFINANLNSNINTLLLKGSTFPDTDIKEIVEQIEAKKRCQKKLPTWSSSENIYYPYKLSIEQTSSEITAKYKSTLISGNSIIDLTGGFGVDCFYFSKVFKNVKHCEINEHLSKIVSHNCQIMNVQNIQSISVDGIEHIKANKIHYDWIYIDPSRRHEAKGKVFFLKDCLPNVPVHLNILFKYSTNILIKTSPLLDLSIGINELKHVKTIHVVAVNNEVKELLWVLEKSFNGNITIKTANLKNQDCEYFDLYINEEKPASASFSEPLTYLYEPNSAILKAGAFNTVSNKLKVFKLHKHSHLYTSDNLVDFPGRVFKIEKIIPYNKKEFKKLRITQANITTRNFTESVQSIRKKFNIKDGGDTYLFFTTDIKNNKIIIICTK
jgi:hypothetical protein